MDDASKRKEKSMTQIWKRSVVLLVAAALALGMVGLLPGTSQQAQAATKSHMKSLNLKWDLKKNKTVNFKTSYPGAGFQSVSATVKSLKITKSNKKGYKKATITVVFKDKFKPPKKQIKAMKYFDGDWNVTWGNAWLAVVDYETGKTFDNSKEKNVAVKYGNWKHSGGTTFKHPDGQTIIAGAKWTIKVTITYPANYKNLCIGVGGDNTHYGSYTADDASWSKDKEGLFWNGKAPFGKTSLYDWKLHYRTDLDKEDFYTKSKINSHWMRIK